MIPVTIEQVISPFFARVKWGERRLDTVSTTPSAPGVHQESPQGMTPQEKQIGEDISNLHKDQDFENLGMRMTQDLCMDSAPEENDDVGQRADSVTTELADHAGAEVEEWTVVPRRSQRPRNAPERLSTNC